MDAPPCNQLYPRRRNQAAAAKRRERGPGRHASPAAQECLSNCASAQITRGKRVGEMPNHRQ
eukprot:5379123-Lingulodinium_polyedra.AAC.1